MQNRNINKNGANDTKGKSKGFWKNVGFIALALLVSIITVLVLNLNIFNK